MVYSERPALPPRPLGRESPRLRAFLLACGLAALAVGTLAPLLAPPRTDVVATWLQTTIVPGAILVLLLVNTRARPTLLALTCALLYLEAILTAGLYTIGIAFSILLPIMGIGLVQPHVRGRVALGVYVGAAVTATFSVALFALSVPTNPLDEPGLAVVGFGFLAAFALGLIWRAGRRTVEALDAAGREIAARTEAELALGGTVHVLETLIRSSPLATLAVDDGGRVTLWNPAAERLFGWTDEETIGRPLPEELAAGTGWAQLTDAVRRTLAGEAVEGEQIELRHKDGRELTVELHGAPRFDGEQLPGGTILQLIDVTERTLLEVQLRQAQKMEAVGQLAGGVAHDINNTLTAVGGFAELIRGAATDPEVLEDADTIVAAVQRGSQLTRQLLAFARRSLLLPQVVDVAEFVSSIEPMLRRLLGSSIVVVVRHEISAGRIRVDPGQLEQAILNLTVNARDAMPGGGTLTISTRRAVKPDPAKGEGANWIVLSVSDTGTGIPPAVRDQVFEPFFTTKEPGKGTGLGLAMVYGFVAQSGGEVFLHSDVGVGTMVEICLPEVEEAPDEAPSDASSTSLAGRETILVIEDEPAVADLARQVLERRGYRVLLAERPEEAVELAASSTDPIDLVVSDVIMPGMLGPAVAARVRELHPEAGVLYASGYTSDAIAEQGILHGDVDLIEKPYTTHELARRVRLALERTAAERTQDRR